MFWLIPISTYSAATWFFSSESFSVAPAYFSRTGLSALQCESAISKSYLIISQHQVFVTGEVLGKGTVKGPRTKVLYY